MLSTVKILSIIAAMLLCLAMTATAQSSNAEELVFSKTGGFMPLEGNSTTGGTPFGFWIWCAFHASPSSTPVTYQGAHVCQGTMYFYFLGVPEHVSSAFMTAEGPEGTYTIKVIANDFVCTLQNIGPPTSGPTNKVTVSCTFSGLGGGSGAATVDGAVVHATGPG